jgi:transposase
MLKETEDQFQTELYLNIDDLVPKDHLLRKIAKSIDFRFIEAKTKDLYSTTGRPGINPVILFKMLFIGYLFGIRSERQLVKEIEVNLAYRWFLGFGFRDKIPHYSTLSQNRRRRFTESTIYHEIFDEIVWQAMNKGMVDGKTLYTDSTHLKANANKNKYTKQQATDSAKSYLAELEEAVNADRQANDKDSLPPSDGTSGSREIKVSTTDKDSGYMVRDGKPKGFFYLDHRTVDSKYNIITDSYVTPANIHDSRVYLDRLDHQRGKFGFNVRHVGLDAGYMTAHICKGLLERDIYGVIPYRAKPHRKGYFYIKEFDYDKAKDVYTCPNGLELKYRTTNRGGNREYVSDGAVCIGCEDLCKCTSSRNHQRVITRHVWQDAVDAVYSNRLTEKGKKIYGRRKETVERSFADAKELHGHRYARMRGIGKVFEQCLLSAAVQNMKKIALVLSYLFIYFREMLEIWVISDENQFLAAI